MCGAVRYRTEEEDPPCYVCYCTDCQRRSGSSHALTMPLWRDKFTVEGKTVQGARTLASGVAATVHSCPVCLTEIYSHNEQLPDIVTLRAGTLDDAKSLTPAAYMWIGSRQPWIELPHGARTYDTQPTDPVEWGDILEFRRRSV